MLSFKSPVAKRYFCKLKLSMIPYFMTSFMANFLNDQDQDADQIKHPSCN